MKKKTLRSEATASGAYRWMNCPSSVTLCQGLSELPKKYADEGTKAHQVAAELIELYYKASKGAQVTVFQPNESINFYVDYVIKGINWDLVDTFRVEERLPFLQTSGGIDCYVVYKSGIAEIFDFKYGVGLPLQAPDNEQLAFYACSVADKHKCKNIHVHLIQPRVTQNFDDPDFKTVPNVSTWLLPHSKLKSWKLKFAKALIAVDKNAGIKKGNWCQFCKAKSVCPAWVGEVSTAITGQNDALIPNFGAISTDRVVEIYKRRKDVEHWFKKAEEFLTLELLSGKVLEGVEIEEKKTHRRWKTNELSTESIAEVLKSRGIENPYTQELISVSTASKLCQTEDLIYKPKGEPRAVVVERDRDRGDIQEG